ncbi:MAG: nucleotidyltransferase domain-containing protein [Candidatus Heimdallarchaeota archaeon]|nr:nucleotidyltransferase domain-containing protein [Candidatus Heimdallarchaeota archaeon]MCK5143098.1 nucleotidyltransferase domain-containing protein [Candidatus Heimdallarchaeota archaeon]
MNMEEISEILKEEVIKNHPEIAIIAIYGSAARGQQTEFSDLDMYAVLDNEEKKFEIHFVLNNQTAEFWCISWEWIEKIVTAESGYGAIIFPVAADIFVNNKIIYARSEEDKIRFKKLSNQASIGERKQLQIASNNFYEIFKLIEKLENAKEKDDLLTARWAVWNFINGTVCILGFINNKRYTKNWGSNLHEVFKLDILPGSYREDILILATSNDFNELISSGKRIIRQLRTVLYSKREDILVDYDEQIKSLAESYVGIKSYLNKILSACAKKDILAASYAATELQLCIADEIEKTESRRSVDSISFNTYQEVKNTYEMLKLPDLSQSITEKDFEKLRDDVETLDKMLVSYLKEKDVELKIFDDVSEIRGYARTK